MSMHYLVNVPRIETDWGLEFYTPTAHVSLDWPFEGNPNYEVRNYNTLDTPRDFPDMASALDWAAQCLRAS